MPWPPGGQRLKQWAFAGMTSLFARRAEPSSAGHRDLEASQEDLQVWAQLELSRLAAMAPCCCW